MDIIISNLTKTFDRKSQLIFNDLDVRFDTAKITVVLGKSGVGKSSLLNLIAGIDTPDRGSITIGGTRVSDMDDTLRTRFRRRHIGFVFQSFNLIPVLTVMENITLVSQLDGHSLSQSIDRAYHLLREVGLESKSHDYPDRLSGGEQQRVALARALINDPEIILADEPTGNLDEETGSKILGLISDQVRSHHKTLIMVTHSREAVAHADQIFNVTNHSLIPNGSRT